MGLGLAWKAVGISMLLTSLGAAAQDLNLSPTRPTIANSATIQSAGVVQVEVGYDAYPERVPGNMETVATSVFYVPLARLRLDFGWSSYAQQAEVKGVGTVTLGGKVEVKKEDYHMVWPGVAVQYEAELPTATRDGIQNYGQQAIVLVNHHYLRDGILDVIVNGSLVQEGCQVRCSYGGQQSVSLSYHLNKVTRLYGEVFAQNNSESNTPPGTYVFGGFYRQFGDAFGVDGGMRFGVSNHSASVGTTVGVVFGRRVAGRK